MIIPPRPAISRLAALFLLLLTLSCAVASHGHAAEQFTPAQRAEIVRIMREALKQDPTILRDAVAAMKDADTREQAVESSAAIASQHDALFNAGDPVAGNPHGAVTIVEFFDARCPYCRGMEPTMAQFLEKNPDVRLIYKDLPILGPPSVVASRALLAAQKQGGYEKLRDVLMQAPPDFTIASIRAAALKVGLDWSRLERDMHDPSIQQRLNANLQLAHTLGIEGTPALVIGKELIPGAVQLADLQRATAAARGQADQ